MAEQEDGFGVQSHDGLPVVTPPAELDLGNVIGLREALRSACGQHPVVVVDLSRTVFCDSMALRALLEGRDLAARNGGELRLVLGAAQLLRIFAVTGFDVLFPVFYSLPEALAGEGRRPAAS
jgi:anti-sigma B factor antagonist